MKDIYKGALVGGLTGAAVAAIFYVVGDTIRMRPLKSKEIQTITQQEPITQKPIPQEKPIIQEIPIPQETYQPGSSLVDKLEPVCINLQNRLSQGALTSTEYSEFVHEQFKSQNILPVLSYQEASILEEMLSYRLLTKEIKGLFQDYIVNESTPLSDAVNNDISEYEKIKTEVVADLINQKKPTKWSARDYLNSVRELILSKNPSLPLVRVDNIAINIIYETVMKESVKQAIQQK